MGSKLSLQKDALASIKRKFNLKEVLLHCDGVSLKIYSRLLPDSSEQRVRIKKFKIGGNHERAQLQRELEAKQQIKSQNLASIIAFRVQDTKSRFVCMAQSFLVKIAMEDYEDNLESEIQKRKAKGQRKFKERDLVILTNSLVSACLELQNIGFPHKDIQPRNVLFRPNGQVILADDIGLSLKWRANEFLYTKTQQMIQGIGVTVLCAASLTTFEQMFSREQFSFENFLRALRKSQECYSSSFVNLIAGIVKMKSKNVTLAHVQMELEYLFDKSPGPRMKPAQVNPTSPISPCFYSDLRRSRKSR